MIIKPRRKVDRKLLEMVRRSPCSVCGKRHDIDASHIRSRGAGGPDEVWNVFPHCRQHHIEWHQYGPSKFFERYPHFRRALAMMGWEFTDSKIWHPNLSPTDECL